MKKILFILLAACITLSFSSCTSCSRHKKTFTEKKMEFRETLTSEDTTQMLKLADDCMELLKKKDIDKAIGMLNEYDDSLNQVLPLSAKTEQSLRKQFKFFPVCKYEREYFSFMLEGLNDVRYKIWFSDEPATTETGEAVTKFMFNPIRIDGTWYLCVKSAKDDFDVLHR